MNRAGLSRWLLVLTLGACVLRAAAPQGCAEPGPPPEAEVARAGGASPTAAEWAAAPEMLLSGEASRTGVRALWSPEALFIAMEAVEATPFTREPEKGGSLHTQDVFEVFIDPVGDARQYYELQVALSGALFFKNFLLSAPPVTEADGVLDPAFRAAECWSFPLPVPPEIEATSRRDPQSGLWRVEVRLPASLLHRRRPGKPLTPGTLRANFVRHDWRNAREVSFLYWSPVRPGHPHLSPGRMGALHLKEGEAAP